MKIGIIVAMEKELEQLREAVAGGSRRHQVTLQKCGMGKVNAALGTQRMIDNYKPDLIVSSGCAGGVGSGLSVCDVVVGSTVAYHDVYCGPESALGQVQGLPPFYEAPAPLVEKAIQVGAKAGLFASGDWFVDSVGKAKQILECLPEAVAIDMESAAIAQVCWLNHVPFISLRVISDLPLSEGNRQQYDNFWTTIANNSFQATKAFIDRL
jgi:adenosylhomocysteine nucleosidase